MKLGCVARSCVQLDRCSMLVYSTLLAEQGGAKTGARRSGCPAGHLFGVCIVQGPRVPQQSPSTGYLVFITERQDELGVGFHKQKCLAPWLYRSEGFSLYSCFFLLRNLPKTLWMS